MERWGPLLPADWESWTAAGALRGRWRTLRLYWKSRAAFAEMRRVRGLVGLPAANPQLRISIVMPTRNRSHMIGEAVRSVQAQSHAAWELLIVDDASTDDTPALLAELAAADPRIRCLRQETSAGVSAARNLALASATGEVVAYLDDDNAWFPDYLEALAAMYDAHPQAQCAHAAQLWLWTAREEVTFPRFTWEDLRIGRLSLDMNCFSHRLALVAALGAFDPQLKRYSDWDLTLRYTRSHEPMAVPRMAVRYRAGDHTRITNQVPSGESAFRIECKFLPPLPRPLRVMLVVYDYPQLSESYIHAEIRALQSRGVSVEVVSWAEPISRGVATAPVTVGLEHLQQRAAAFRPHVVHVHWITSVLKQRTRLQALGLPVTVKAHGFDHSAKDLDRVLALPWVRRVHLFPHLHGPGFVRKGKLVASHALVDTSRYYPEPGKDGRLVLRCGACLPTKELDLFIRVAALRPEYRFRLVLSTNASGAQTRAELLALNEQLGQPVEILEDVQYPEMAAMMRKAGVYLHTFGYSQPFGEPISIAEAMACGTVPLLREGPGAREYGGSAAMYYNGTEEASRLLKDMLDWPEQRWNEQRSRAVDRAYRHHADLTQIEPMLQDWLSLAGPP